MIRRLAIIRKLSFASVWCGLLASLLAMTVSLNVKPPTLKGYRSFGYVLASQERLEQLSSRSELNEGLKLEAIRTIRAVNPSKSNSLGAPTPTVSTNEELAGGSKVESEKKWLAQITCFSESPLTHRELQTILDDSTRNNIHLHPDTPLKRKMRGAQWIETATAHALQQTQSPSLENAGDGLSFVSTGQIAKAVSREQLELEESLKSRLESARRDVEALNEQEALMIDSVSGTLRIAHQLSIQPVTGTINLGYACSILCVGLVSFGLMAWIYLALSTRRKFTVDDVAGWLTQNGIPSLGDLPIISRKESDNIERATKPRSPAIITRACEIGVAGIALAISVRLFTDENWRDTAQQNLLFALGRIFTGI